MKCVDARKSLELDFRSVLTELRKRPSIPSSDVWGSTEDIFSTRFHHYRRIDDSTLLHILDFQVVQPYSIDTARPDLVCIQIILTGTYTRLAAEYLDVVGPAHVQITNFPRALIDASGGSRLRGILIVMEREHMIDHFGLHVDRIPLAYRPIFSSNVGMIQAMKLPALSSVRISTEQILSCRFPEPLKNIYLANKTLEIICDIVHQLNSSPHSRFASAAPGKIEAIEAAAAIYRREFHSPPTIEQLALRVGVNRNILAKGFLDRYGLTPHAFCLDLRMNAAQDFLRAGDVSVSEVGRRVGYGGYASFSRAFIEYFGYSPSSARSMDREILEESL